jgi:hypothetical protein
LSHTKTDRKKLDNDNDGDDERQLRRLVRQDNGEAVNDPFYRISFRSIWVKSSELDFSGALLSLRLTSVSDDSQTTNLPGDKTTTTLMYPHFLLLPFILHCFGTVTQSQNLIKNKKNIIIFLNEIRVHGTTINETSNENTIVLTRPLSLSHSLVSI